MPLIQNLLRRLKEKKAMRQEFEDGQRIVEKYEEKKLGSDERELRRFQEHERQIAVKAALKRYREREQHEIWSGQVGNPLYAEDVVKGQKNLFANDTNLFMHQKSNLNGGSLFFK